MRLRGDALGKFTKAKLARLRTRPFQVLLLETLPSPASVRGRRVDRDRVLLECWAVLSDRVLERARGFHVP